MNQTSLPFLPFVRAEIDEETIQGVADVLRSGWITTGPQNQQFEANLSAYCGGRPVRAFNSGTATMEIGLRIAGVGPGDEVITDAAFLGRPPATSSSKPARRPVFVDIDPVTRNIDLDLLENGDHAAHQGASCRCICRACRSTWTGSTTSRATTSCA